MDTTSMTPESFPKRIRSVSAKFFSMSGLTEHTKRNSFNTTSSSSSSTDYILNPSKWLPRRRHRSSSSASSTFSVVFESNYPTDTHPQILNHLSKSEKDGNLASLNTLSSEMEELYNNAKDEINFAIESQGSIYYEGDIATSQTAVESCEAKYIAVIRRLGKTANTVKFKYRWELDLYQLRLQFDALPKTVVFHNYLIQD
ncbi:hypothetical protein K501DRAFT_239877 [Backusella circina FSU 941]|nr:hypothetical protein K501DRAFT_239877 [Backusella circina FSU 941]